MTSTATVASGDNADSETTARATAAPSSEAVSLSLAQLHSAAPAERRARILAFLQEQVAATLGLEVAAVQPTINLVEFGMDSVLAMRILNGCREALGFVLYPRDLYDRPVLQNFADYLAAEYERFHGAGAPPTGESEASTSPAILLMAATRPFVAPPGVPPDRIAALRKAFEATIADKGFLAEAQKINLPVNLAYWYELEKLIKEVYATPEAIVAQFPQYPVNRSYPELKASIDGAAARLLQG